ncbi:MAG: hypothetical protein ACQR33_02960 [Candidatus Saccharibacteria bacterium]
MNHDRYPTPGAPYEAPEAPQYAPDPSHSQYEANLADFYNQPYTTPGDSAGELPQPVEVPGHGQLTAPMPERIVPYEQPQYAPPAGSDIAKFYAQQPWQRPPQPRHYEQGDYVLAPPQREAVPQMIVDPGRIGFRGLAARLRGRMNRR